MRKRTKLAVLLAVLFIALGALLGCVVMMSIDFDPERLDTTPVYTAESKELLEPFESVVIEQSSADVKIIATNAKFPVIQYMECEGISYEISNEEGVLTVREVDTRPWYKKIVPGFGEHDEIATILHLPQKAYQHLRVDTASGDVTVSDAWAPFGEEINEGLYGELLRFAVVDVKTASGDISYLAELGDNAPMMLQSASGDITLRYASMGVVNLLTASGDVSIFQSELQALVIKTGSGDVEVKGVTAAQSTVETTSGDIVAQQLYSNAMTVESTSGEIKLENLTAATILRVEVTSGDVKGVGCYATELYVNTVSGDVDLRFTDGIDVSTETTSGTVTLTPRNEDNRGEGKCYVTTVSGDIDISRPPLPLWFN